MSGIQTHFDDFQASHIQLADRVYLTPQFLPWHRYFLHIYEKALRTEFRYKGATLYSQCGYPSQDKDDYHRFNIAYVGEYKKKNTTKDVL
ncbi:hypothetical protein BYT27DRAFT_7200262 [Phlegmacium glaucopus]|nr:hypothetical protein BYT27DRAFT_7200262 [Phlegmacium glaucopus]